MTYRQETVLILALINIFVWSFFINAINQI